MLLAKGVGGGEKAGAVKSGSFTTSRRNGARPSGSRLIHVASYQLAAPVYGPLQATPQDLRAGLCQTLIGWLASIALRH
jgi:hypothetical protein